MQDQVVSVITTCPVVCGVHSIVHISTFCLAFMRKGPPEISIEWMDVTIDIKVCGSDIPPEDRKFVRWHFWMR